MQAKHHCQGIEELIAIRESLDEKVQSTAALGEDLIGLKEERDQLKNQVQQLAESS